MRQKIVTYFIFFCLSLLAVVGFTSQIIGDKKPSDCMFLSKFFVPNHAPTDGRCQFLADISDDHKKNNTPTAAEIIDHTWVSLFKEDYKAHITIRPGVYETIQPDWTEGGHDTYREFVILDEKPEDNMLMVFIKSEYHYDFIKNPPEYYHMPNRYRVVMFSIMQDVLRKEPVLKIYHCSFFKDSDTPVKNMTDDEVRAFYQAYVRDRKQEMKDKNDPYMINQCWPEPGDFYIPWVLSTGSWSNHIRVSKPD